MIRLLLVSARCLREGSVGSSLVNVLRGVTQFLEDVKLNELIYVLMQTKAVRTSAVWTRPVIDVRGSTFPLYCS